jgi:hypothetical protein
MVNILLGKAGGKFESARSVAVGPAPLGSIFVGDFNGDRRSDLALSVNRGQTSVLFNDGSW